MTALARPVRPVDRFAAAKSACRTLLVHVQPEAAAEPRLAAAADLARKLDATLFGVAAEMIDPVGLSDPYGLLPGAYAEALQGRIEADVTAARDTFVKYAEGLDAEWLTVESRPAQVIAALSRAADLIVAGGSPLADADGYRWCDPAELMLLSGRPVLVAPPTGRRLHLDAAVVAWKDTREARRALADSLPFLTAAAEVVVMEVCSKDERSDAEGRTASVIEGLTRHGIQARAKIVVAGAEAVCAQLNAEADVIGADLIISGGYGHSRLGEWAFGGVTRDLLKTPERFVLLSH